MYIKGDVKIFLNNNIINLKRGDIVIIPPNYAHRLILGSVDVPYERLYLYITETCLSSFQFNEYSLLKPLIEATKLNRLHYNVNKDTDYKKLVYAIDKIRDSKKQNYYGKEMMNRSYIMQFLTIINDYIVKENCENIQDETKSLITMIMAYIDENFMENITLESLSKQFFTNRFTITQVFKEHTNLTIHNYIILKRIEYAKKLIYSGVHPTKVFTNCGFKNYATFYRAFKRIEEISPQEFVELSKKHFI
jgi:YesN/AraC family two-component response regulator